MLLRAAVLLVADLVEQGWTCRVERGGVKLTQPNKETEVEAERVRVRRQLHLERNRQLRNWSVTDFIRSMEQRRYLNGRWVSVFSLMRDGEALSAQLSNALEGKLNIREIVRPYIQVITSDSVCEHTGLQLMNVWRYFRHTWANAYRTVPGRSLAFLIRDAAADEHPVIGIAALASSAVQIKVRDEWIGWDPQQYVEFLRRNAKPEHVRWLADLIRAGLQEIYVDDLLDTGHSPLRPAHFSCPTAEMIDWLNNLAREKRDEHHRLVDSRTHKRKMDPGNQAHGGHWWAQAESLLFKSKRAETLALILRARMVLEPDGYRINASQLQITLGKPQQRQVLQSLIRRAKSERVGICMADISVCGAVPPYSHLLGGKLIAMLIASPEVIIAYRDRYANAHSVIASSLAGRPIVKRPELVFLGTTSLYGTEPTQYTRVYVPCNRGGGSAKDKVRYTLLGKTAGVGTLQFSEETVDALGVIVSQQEDGQRVNSIFGEGSSPRLRKIREGLDLVSPDSNVLLDHGSPRIVYGIALVSNVRDYLLGIDKEPKYLIPLANPAGTTKAIGEWWADRWLTARLQKTGILEEIAQHRLTYPVTHGARVAMPSTAESGLLFEDLATCFAHSRSE